MSINRRDYPPMPGGVHWPNVKPPPADAQTSTRAVNPAHDILVSMRTLLGDPAHWCQCAPAMDSRGIPCLAADPEAACWCLIGAALRFVGPVESPSRRHHLYREVQDAIKSAIKGTYLNWVTEGVEAWNDQSTRTHDDIIRVLDQAVASTA